ncbi:hypothetical protein DFH01_21855 [Falsiroseomonas bella]|uniref:PEP-CTERM protein-sorting domain-containing protein n=1 Tax=Falsiroseomonas bella TaxID=2184016 RepID=A0A317F6Z4_9PROT|nr:hypothetical protein [Falsiroseomonas bella]PWS34981.1 hypothetical protein DFH01_21855 [Falsiroseomonas bella]
MSRSGPLLLAAAILMGPVATSASPVPFVPLPYDMPNGDGVASGGTFNYWDALYNGAGNTMQDGAPLSGGWGKLTDGVAATTPWFADADLGGTGLYVGWRRGFTTDPTLTFLFPVPVCLCVRLTIDSVTIWLDNTGVGGVGAPLAILLDGLPLPFAPPAPGTVGPVAFGGLGLRGPFHDLQFVQDPALPWTMVSEIQWTGFLTYIPAPGAVLLFGPALAFLGAFRRRAG